MFSIFELLGLIGVAVAVSFATGWLMLPSKAMTDKTYRAQIKRIRSPETASRGEYALAAAWVAILLVALFGPPVFFTMRHHESPVAPHHNEGSDQSP